MDNPYVIGGIIGGIVLLVILLIVRRRRRIAKGLPVFYPFKKGMVCPVMACRFLFYVRRREIAYTCPKCGEHFGLLE